MTRNNTIACICVSLPSSPSSCLAAKPTTLVQKSGSSSARSSAAPLVEMEDTKEALENEAAVRVKALWPLSSCTTTAERCRRRWEAVSVYHEY